jgi:predicted TIM-barrel fold metal-dependent hydrolase
MSEFSGPVIDAHHDVWDLSLRRQPWLVDEPQIPSDRAWRAGFARLAPLGLHFELQVPWWHLHEAADLAASYEDTAIVVNHTGLPADRSPRGLTGWRKALRTVAERPSIFLKIPGIDVPGEQRDLAEDFGHETHSSPTAS